MGNGCSYSHIEEYEIFYQYTDVIFYFVCDFTPFLSSDPVL